MFQIREFAQVTLDLLKTGGREGIARRRARVRNEELKFLELPDQQDSLGEATAAELQGEQGLGCRIVGHRSPGRFRAGDHSP